MATLDDFTHLPEQEGEQQGTNVGAVYVGVRHDNDGVVTQFVRVEFFPADTATEGGNQRAHFGRRQHLVETGFLYVQDLTLQRQDGLVFPSRPCLALPPAESPSTMNSSDRAGSFSWQSASLPGRPAISSAPLRRVISRALRAASRARAASIILLTITLASFGFSCR